MGLKVSRFNFPGMTTYFSNRFLFIRNFPRGGIVSWGVFLIAAVFYLLTADRFASYWDCPEYITVASLLEVGHPPGNPVWTLAMRMATLFFPRSLHPAVINACSALFMAGASFFLCRILYYFIESIFFAPLKERWGERVSVLLCSLASAGGSLCFVFCDSTWFSAVEAEVYAMSAFMFTLILWLSVRGSIMKPPVSTRQLFLIAYLLGLSLGIHQLNLLGIPVIAMIWLYRKRKGRITPLKIIATLLVAFGIVCVILTGMMPGLLSWARMWEWYSVNFLGWPYHSGVIVYTVFLFMVFLFSVFVTGKESFPPILKAIVTGLLFAFSGFFAFGGTLVAGIILSLVFAGFLFIFYRRKRNIFAILVWSAGFLILGFSSFAIIYIRSLASPPLNEGSPSDIFAFSSYIGREQYGSTPLLYGPTPLSKPLMEEQWDEKTGKPMYRRYLFKKGNPRIVRTHPEAHLFGRSGLSTEKDSLLNSSIIKKGREGYLLSDYNIVKETTPELNMWFPRMTSMDPGDFQSYANWSGIDYDNMVEVKISETKDSLGNYVTKISDKGIREEKRSYRPTYLQQLRYLFTYQTYYMYIRYLLWNFFGRQNDYHSMGEIEHGNFISGIDFLDHSMVGHQIDLPDYAGKENPGHNIYYGIPFLLGLLGIIILALIPGKKSSGVFWVTMVWFVMTGIAVVVYLNQSPGEPRERDYTFLANYMVFACWIGIGLMTFIKLLLRAFANRKVYIILSVLLSLSPGILMAVVNFNDHDRRGRGQPLEYVTGVLGMETPAIIFSQGDNYSFPLWYGQEVEGLGSGHTIVDVSYLSTPKYILNLMKQGSKGIKITARPGDIMYDAYAFVGISRDADTTPVPLIKALRDLYSQKEGKPEFKYSKVTLPANGSTDETKSEIIIDLKEYFHGKFITFAQLMLLDIIATNLDSGENRPIYFLNPVSSSFYQSISQLLRQDIHGKIYYPSLPDSLRHEYLLRNSFTRLKSLQGKKLPAYIDPVIEDQMMRRRGELVIASRELANLGFLNEAAEILNAAYNRFPLEKIHPGQMVVSDTLFNETLEAVRLWNRIHEESGSQEAFDNALELCDTLKDFTDAWMKYYVGVPENRRGAVSRTTRNLLSAKPKVDSIYKVLNEKTNNGIDLKK